MSCLLNKIEGLIPFNCFNYIKITSIALVINCNMLRLLKLLTWNKNETEIKISKSIHDTVNEQINNGMPKAHNKITINYNTIKNIQCSFKLLIKLWQIHNSLLVNIYNLYAHCKNDNIPVLLLWSPKKVK